MKIKFLKSAYMAVALVIFGSSGVFAQDASGITVAHDKHIFSESEQHVPVYRVTVNGLTSTQLLSDWETYLKKNSKQNDLNVEGNMVTAEGMTIKKLFKEREFTLLSLVTETPDGAVLTVSVRDSSGPLSTQDPEVGVPMERFVVAGAASSYADKLKGELKDESKVLKNEEKQLNSVRKEIDKREEKILGIQSRIRSIEQEISVLKTESAKMMEQVKNKKVEQLDYTDNKKMRKVINKDIKSIEKANKKIIKSIEKENKKIYKHEAEIRDLRHEIDQYDRERQIQVKRIEDLKEKQRLKEKKLKGIKKLK